MDTWESLINGFESYLLLERGLSANSVESYISDVHKLARWTTLHKKETPPSRLSREDIQHFIEWINELLLSRHSQARILSGVKAFYRYLMVEQLLDASPAELIEGPKSTRHIPEVLSYEEIIDIIGAIDLSHPQGHRNKAIIETLYACGLRVSELISMRLSYYYPDMGIVRVIGKNDKERLVPIGDRAIQAIDWYINHSRKELPKISPQDEDIIFLNRRGKRLTRVMIFTLVKQYAQAAGVTKKVSPHTFRHSFATHMVERGADLKAVQDMLGHASITTTEIYTHMDSNYLRDVIMKYHPLNQ